MDSFNPVDMFKHMSWLDKSVVILLLVMSVYSLVGHDRPLRGVHEGEALLARLRARAA